MRIKRSYLSNVICLLVSTWLVGMVLASSEVSADDSATTITTITVPIACTMRGVGMNTHTATLSPGTYSGASGSEYEDGIGKTTLTAICNDDNGFSIYAIGYTGNEYGVTNLVGQNTNGTIATKAYASGDTTSNWSMKTTKINDATESYNPQNLTIQNSFDAWHAVPADYTRVAQYKANTGSSTTDTTLGVKLETTYAAFIAPNQPADTYVGQVKYTLVHPYDADSPVGEEQVGVIYDGNGSTFAGGGTTNRVVYGEICEPLYIGNTPTEVTTSNINSGGTQNGAYTNSENVYRSVSFTGASQVKVIVDYGITANTMEIILSKGDGINWDNYEVIEPYESNTIDSATYIFDGDTVTIEIQSYGTPVTDYDYGTYVRFYPVYTTELLDTTEMGASLCNTGAVVGAYSTTTQWYGSWYAEINGEHYDFVDENDVIDFIDGNSTLLGTTIHLYRGYSFAEAYQNASKTQTGGYYTIQDLNDDMCHTVAISQIETVIDTRDNNTYSIGKIKDGKCWMRENMRLDPTNSTIASNMSANNTNASAAAISNYLNGGSSETGWSNTAVSNVTSGFNSYTVPMVNNTYKDYEMSYVLEDESVIYFGKYGLFYNYCAASIGTYCYSENQGADMQDTDVDVQYDICPSNWRMPTTNEFDTLISNYPSVSYSVGHSHVGQDLQLDTHLLSGAGYYDSDHRVHGGDFDWSYIWASTFATYSNSHMGSFSIDNSAEYFVFVSSGNRTYGYSVRCIAK